MLHEYKKKTTIKAEQFDGSTEMMDKYHMYCAPTGEFDDDGFSIVGYYLPTKEGNMEVEPFAYIATGIDGEHWAIDVDTFRKAYEEVKQ